MVNQSRLSQSQSQSPSQKQIYHHMCFPCHLHEDNIVALSSNNDGILRPVPTAYQSRVANRGTFSYTDGSSVTPKRVTNGGVSSPTGRPTTRQILHWYQRDPVNIPRRILMIPSPSVYLLQYRMGEGYLNHPSIEITSSCGIFCVQ